MRCANVFFFNYLALVPDDNHGDLPCILDIDMFHLLVSILWFVFEILFILLYFIGE